MALQSMSKPTLASRPTLSVCMIVKNEERFLAQCLESVTPVADEIIVVDTGSTDSTVEIARRYTDKVHFFEWNDSFSDARNASLSYATSDWILVIDADEELIQEDIPLLERTLAELHSRSQVNAVMMAVLNRLSGHRTGKHYSKRLFRRGKAHYEAAVHEQVVHEGLTAVGAEIRLYHYGYDLDPEKRQAKLLRMERLLSKQVAEDPENTFAWMNLIRIWRNQGRTAEVIREGLRLADHPKATAATRQTMLCDALACLATEGRIEEALEVGERILAENPKHLDALFLSALAAFEVRDYEKTLSLLNRYLRAKHEERVRGVSRADLMLDYYDSMAAAWFHIGRARAALGESKRAVDAFRRAIREDPATEEYYQVLASVQSASGRQAEAVGVLQRGLEALPSSLPLWLMLGDTHRSLGAYDDAADAYRRACDLAPDAATPWLGLGLALMAQGEVAAALPYLEDATRLDGHNLKALRALLQAQRTQGLKEQAIATLDRLLGCEGLGAEDSLAAARAAIALGAYDRAVSALQLYLGARPDDLGALLDLSACYAKQGYWAAAIEGYGAAARLAPEDPRVRRGLRDLQRMVAQAAL